MSEIAFRFKNNLDSAIFQCSSSSSSEWMCTITDNTFSAIRTLNDGSILFHSFTVMSATTFFSWNEALYSTQIFVVISSLFHAVECFSKLTRMTCATARSLIDSRNPRYTGSCLATKSMSTWLSPEKTFVVWLSETSQPRHALEPNKCQTMYIVTI